MKVYFTGTGTSQGIPVIGCTCPVCQSSDPKDNRFRTAALIEWEDGTIAIDAGPDFRQQILRAGINHLDGVLLTHEHNDHMSGLDDIRPFYFRRGQDFPFYATDHVQNEVRNRFSYFFDAEPYPGVPRIHFHEIKPYQHFWVNGLEIMPVLVDHGRLDVMGFRIGEFCYITDAKKIPPKTMETLEGVRVLVLNALRHTVHYSHLSLNEAIEIGDQLGVERLFLTHMSHEIGLHEIEQQKLPPWVNFAYDGLVIQV